MARRSTWLYAIASLVFLIVLGALVWHSEGNLGWDESDYLNGGITGFRHAKRYFSSLQPLHSLEFFHRPAWGRPPFMWMAICGLTWIIGYEPVKWLIVASILLPVALFLGLAAYVVSDYRSRTMLPYTLLLFICCQPFLKYSSMILVEMWMCFGFLGFLYSVSKLIETGNYRFSLSAGFFLAILSLSKLTFILFTVGPILYLSFLCYRGKVEVKKLALLFSTVAIIASPWYLKNFDLMIQHALRAADIGSFLGVDIVTPIWKRFFLTFKENIGWPLTVLLALVVWVIRKSEILVPLSHFEKLWLYSFVPAFGILLVPHYFEARYIFPPSVIFLILLAPRLRAALSKDSWSRLILSVGIGMCLINSAGYLIRTHLEQPIPAHFEMGGLLDRLEEEYHVKTVGNVGSSWEWNILKLILVDSRRKNGIQAVGFSDLSAATQPEFVQSLNRMDALIVFKPEFVDSEWLKKAPALNRPYRYLNEVMPTQTRWEQKFNLERFVVYVARPKASGNLTSGGG